LKDVTLFFYIKETHVKTILLITALLLASTSAFAVPDGSQGNGGNNPGGQTHVHYTNPVVVSGGVTTPAPASIGIVQKNVMFGAAAVNAGPVTLTQRQTNIGVGSATQQGFAGGASITITQKNVAGTTVGTPGTTSTVTEYDTRIYNGNANGHDPFDEHNGNGPFTSGEKFTVTAPGTSGTPGTYVKKQVNFTAGITAINRGPVQYTGVQYNTRGSSASQYGSAIGASISISQKNIGSGGPSQTNTQN
jgi:hypothetical protein